MGTVCGCGIDLSANVGQKDLASIDIDSFHLSLLELAGIQDFFGDGVRHISDLKVGFGSGR